MDWIKTYMIEMADLEFRWMEIMEKQNGSLKRRQGSITPGSSPTDQTGQRNSAEIGAGGAGGYPGINSQQQ